MSVLTLDDRGVLVPCPSCGKTNRLQYRAIDKASKCGQCHAELSPPSAPVEVSTVAAFDALISNSPLPVVVDFWAPWCGPCRMVAPELEKVARSTRGEFLVTKVNTDALVELGERYRIRSIPTMALFRDGEEVTRTSGARPAAAIEEFVRAAVQLQGR